MNGNKYMKNGSGLWLLVAMMAIIAGGSPSWLLAEEPLIEIVVQGDRVNVRAKATNNCEVVVQQNFGDVLQAKSIRDTWVEIVPPEGVVLYVLEDYLHGDVVKASTLNVRAGPSPNYNVVGQLSRNDAVLRTGENKAGWVGIKPTSACSLWISRDFVKLKNPSLAKAKRENPPVVDVPVVVVEPVRPVEVIEPAPPTRMPIPDRVTSVQAVQPAVVQPRAIPMPEGQDLLPIQGQGLVAKRQGSIHSYLLRGSGPSKYYLVLDTANGRQTVCYLENTNGALKPYRGKSVMLEGWDYWVQGQKLPLMVVDRIRELP